MRFHQQNPTTGSHQHGSHQWGPLSGVLVLPHPTKGPASPMALPLPNSHHSGDGEASGQACQGQLLKPPSRSLCLMCRTLRFPQCSPSGGSRPLGPEGWKPPRAHSIICLFWISTTLEVSVSSFSGHAGKIFPALLLATCQGSRGTNHHIHTHTAKVVPIPTPSSWLLQMLPTKSHLHGHSTLSHENLPARLRTPRELSNPAEIQISPSRPPDTPGWDKRAPVFL